MLTSNRPAARLVATHFLGVIGEWATSVAVLVYAFEWGGASATGLASLVILAPSIVGASATASVTDRFRPHRVRQAGFIVQTLAFGLAALAARADLSAPVVVASVLVGVGGLNTLRPTSAVLLPSMARSSKELTSGSLWMTHGESASSLIGPLLAAGLLGIGGAEAVFGVGFVVAFISTLITTLDAGPDASGNVATPVPVRSSKVIRRALVELRTRPWCLGLLGVATARNLLVGAFDVLLVIVALRSLDMGPSGAGLLTALVGAGALISTLFATLSVRRARLRPALMTSLALAAGLCPVLALFTTLPVYLLVLPIIGICLALMDNLSRILMLRSTDPASVGTVFAIFGFLTGAGQLGGSALAQILVAFGGVTLALSGIGIVLALILVLSARALRDADDHADVPVVEMSLLRRLPMLAPLPALSLEAVARSAVTTEVADSVPVIEQGDRGDRFYAVVEGAFDVLMSGDYVRTLRRGDSFGEIALLADVPRTASVVAQGPGTLLEIHRDPFLLAVTGHAPSLNAARRSIATLRMESPLPNGFLHDPTLGHSADRDDPGA